MSQQLGILGGGVMGEALLSRIVALSTLHPDQILVCEPLLERRQTLEQRYGISSTHDSTALAHCATLLLAVKPQVFDQVIAALPRQSGQLVISILAGTPLAKLEAAFPGQAVLRAMPNTPATVGAGITAIAPGLQVTAAQLQFARKIFAAVGQVVEVPESLMDAVTGLSGSGPAYIALVVEALSDGGVAVGLPRAIAQQLALETVRGTAELLIQSQWHPAELKDRVTSPGGTTIAAVASLERAGLRSALMEAVRVATLRAQELG
jgi:pyrroline-5-carboxylate reductase